MAAMVLQDEDPEDRRQITGRQLAVILAVAAVLSLAREVFIPLAIAMLITFALSPAVTALRKRGLPKVVAVMGVVLVAFALIGLFFLVVAAFPLFLAFAVVPDWSAVLWTAALFMTVELLTSNVIEPWLYGSRTGVSPLAIIVAAIFWTFLWGPLGLVLSTPLTVCLVVLGRYLPQFKLFDILLGDQPVLVAHDHWRDSLGCVGRGWLVPDGMIPFAPVPKARQAEIKALGFDFVVTSADACRAALREKFPEMRPLVALEASGDRPVSSQPAALV